MELETKPTNDPRGLIELNDNERAILNRALETSFEHLRIEAIPPNAELFSICFMLLGPENKKRHRIRLGHDQLEVLSTAISDTLGSQPLKDQEVATAMSETLRAYAAEVKVYAAPRLSDDAIDVVIQHIIAPDTIEPFED